MCPPAGDDWVKVWANDPEVEVRHDNPRWTRPVHWRAAFETSTVASIALNITAARSKYGHCHLLENVVRAGLGPTADFRNQLTCFPAY